MLGEIAFIWSQLIFSLWACGYGAFCLDITIDY